MSLLSSKMIMKGRGFTMHEEIQARHPGLDWQFSLMPGKRRALKKSEVVDDQIDRLEMITLFGLSNSWMVRKRIIQAATV